MLSITTAIQLMTDLITRHLHDRISPQSFLRYPSLTKICNQLKQKKALRSNIKPANKKIRIKYQFWGPTTWQYPFNFSACHRQVTRQTLYIEWLFNLIKWKVKLMQNAHAFSLSGCKPNPERFSVPWPGEKAFLKWLLPAKVYAKVNSWL